MSYTYTKLFSSITESTIWVEPYATRIVWVSMLAMADRVGRIWASVPGLARRAGVTLEECEAALERFLGPDKYSRTPDNEGRRIEVIDGGWRLLNYDKYREMRDGEARREYQRDWDRANRPYRSRQNPTNPTEADRSRPCPTQAEAEAEAEAVKAKSYVGLVPDVPPLPKKNHKSEAREVLDFLNARTGRAYQPVDANLEFIVGRLKEGATPAQCRQVIVKKAREWLSDEKMAEYLRPATLFNKTKFAQYVGELVP